MPLTHRIPAMLIDADACPVTDIAIACARRHGMPVTLICDTAHHMEREGATTLTVTKGADSADFRLVNLLSPGDVVVTQDYGLAAMCLARRARVMRQDGVEYADDTIDAMLMSRHISRKIRMSGGRVKGPPKRTAADDDAFAQALTRLLDELCPVDRSK